MQMTCAYSCSSSERTSAAPAAPDPEASPALAAAEAEAAAEGLGGAASSESDAECAMRSLASADAVPLAASVASETSFDFCFRSPPAVADASFAFAPFEGCCCFASSYRTLQKRNWRQDMT